MMTRDIKAVSFGRIEDAEERLDADIIQKALVAPTSLIAQNAGVEGEVVVEKVKESEWEFGYNAMTDKYENLVESGVIDPAKVIRKRSMMRSLKRYKLFATKSLSLSCYGDEM